MRALLVIAALLGATASAAAPAPFDGGCAGTLLRASDGTAVAGADAVHGESVNAVVGDGRGGWFVGGELWQVGSLRVQNLAHLDWNGRPSRAFQASVDGRVTALALAGRTLYLAGEFHSVSGVARAGVAAVDATTGRSTRWNPTPGFQPDSIGVSGATVYLGSLGSVVAVDARTGATRGALFPGGSPDSVFGEVAYVKGGSGYYGRIAAFGAASGERRPAPDARGYFSQIVAGPVRVLAAGRFATGGARGVLLAAWDAGSGRLLWRAHAGGSYVNAFAVSGRRVYLGGLFWTLSGRKRPRLGAVDLRTGRVIDWAPSLGAARRWTPLTIATNGSRVYVGSAVTAPGAGLPACARRS